MASESQPQRQHEGNGRVWAYILAMSLLGLVALAALGWAVAWRQSLDEAVLDEDPEEIEAPLAAVVAGTRLAALEAADNLNAGERWRAMVAMNSALRAAQVGQHAAVAELNWAFDHTYDELGQAEREMQLGSPAAAEDHLREAVVSLDPFVGSTASFSAEPPQDLDAYAGALLVNGAGAQIGEVQGFTTGSDGAVAEVQIGGVTDSFAFIDLGGDTVQIPVARLAFGPRPALGYTIVALGTLTDGADVASDVTSIEASSSP